MLCLKCNKDNPADASFCEECGAQLELICPACKASVSPGARFCKKCGTALGPAKAAAPTTVSSAKSQIKVVADGGASEAIEGERKTVTALFADIKGSTEMMEDLDPEKARAIVDPALKLMMEAVHRYDGYVVQSTGDGIFALFGAPVAHEDHPQRALHAALRMQEKLRRYSTKVVADGGTPIQGRVGINTGEVVVRSIHTGAGHVEYTPIGYTTNLASRMQTAAPVGSIAVTEATRKLCEGYFTLKPLGATKVKGVSEPVNVYEVTGLGPLRSRLQRSVGRGLVKFVGRQTEMEALKRALDLAESGHGQVVAAMAEAGVGKSRLFHEFKAVSQAGWTMLETFSVLHGKASAYLPVIDLLHSYFKISGQDDERERREKVNGKVLTLDRSLEDTVPYLFTLLGIVEDDDPLAQTDVQIRRPRTLEAIKAILLRESLNRPLMVIFEDLQWIDDETQALLNLLVESIGTAKILLLLNYRPEYTHSWGNKTYYTQLRLDPLGKENADEMLGSLLGDSAQLGPLKRLIIEKTEGNPFFIEEMVQVLLDEGALVRNGAMKLTKSLSDLKIPPTVQAILASRIDRLPLVEKELLQTLAVIGKSFSVGLIKRVVEGPDTAVEELLSHLQLAEFIYEQPAFPDPVYVFKHALTQEVAYNSILIERRKLLHRRIGTAIEVLHGNRVEDHLGALAHHFRASADVAKAVEYSRRAGLQAARQSGYPQALDHLRAGLALLDALPDYPEKAQQELGLQVALGHCLREIKGLAAPEAQEAYVRARLLCEQTGDSAQLFEVLGGLEFAARLRSDWETAVRLSNERLALAERMQDPAMLLSSHRSLAATQFFLGNYAAAQKELVLAFAIPETGQRLPSRCFAEDRAACLMISGLNSWGLGYPDRALRQGREALAAARKIANPSFLTNVFSWTVSILRNRRDWLAVRDLAEEWAAFCMKWDFPFNLAEARIAHGQVLVERGRGDEGIAEIQTAIEAAEKTGTAWVFHYFWLAECCAKTGRAKVGLAAVERAKRLRGYEPQVLRVNGELILIQDPAAIDEAEKCFREAINRAQSQSAKSMELLASTRLAQLLAKQGKRDEARTMLAEIYNWFTEGFDTADLKDAKTLLDELNG